VYFGSHSAIAPFNLYQPTSAREAVSLFRETGGNFLSGGVDMVPAMRRGVTAKNVISLTSVEDLGRIDKSREHLIVGAGVTWAQLQRESSIQDNFPELASLLNGVANVRIRAAATLGGNIATRNPAYDALPLLHAAGAHLIMDDGDGPQPVSDDAGISSDLPSGLLHSIQIPLRDKHRLLFDRSRKPISAIYIGLWRESSSAGAGMRGTLAIGCAYPQVFSVSLPIDGLKDLKDVAGNAAEISGRLIDTLPDPQTDRHASSDYRRRLIPIQVKRLLEKVAGDQ
jgi:CO/xanthine dehydrogenase FAD-binding subunit